MVVLLFPCVKILSWFGPGLILLSRPRSAFMNSLRTLRNQVKTPAAFCEVHVVSTGWVADGGVCVGEGEGEGVGVGVSGLPSESNLVP